MSASLSEPRNRMVQVLESSTVNGIDFVELKTVDATTLYVHFLNKVAVPPAWPERLTASLSGGDRIRGIQLQPIDNSADWSADALGRPVLALHAGQAGDFSLYTLTLTGGQLDPMYASAAFSFKVLCPAEFDCEPQSACCSPQNPPLPAIDYTAKDFQSFKRALTDFSAQRYPAWQERSEADFGILFMEALCALADELSYLQDRVAAEASLRSATQARSLVAMARLVDYEPVPMLSATTLVQCDVTGSSVPAGALINASTADGGLIPFEIGLGLNDATDYAVSPRWNDGIQPYWFDDSQQCLPCGATSMYLLGHDFNFDAQIAAGKMPLLIQTDLAGESIREVVHLTASRELFDRIFTGASGAPAKVTQISWSPAEALTREHALAYTHLAGNLLPATQGQRYTESFAVGSAPAGEKAMPLAIARYGPDGTAEHPNWIIRYPLAQSSAEQGRLTWLSSSANKGTAGGSDAAKAQPEILVSRRLPEPSPFHFTTCLLDATATETAFTVDPAAWRVVAIDDNGVTTQWEYDGDQGDTIRFGDGVFGAQPEEGNVFDLVYRIGRGAAGNVAAGAIQEITPSASSFLLAVRNPFVVTNGADAESAQHIQRTAPQAFRAEQFRAVRAEDYQAAAETLPWVLKAGTAFRWTGSWLSVFTTADPRTGKIRTASAASSEQIELINLLNRRRLAGYESFAPPPTLVSVDLDIVLCAQMGWLSSDVEAAVLSRLSDQRLPDGSRGFFFADSFTFGTPLYRSALQAAIQSVAGVSGILSIEFRRRGASKGFQPLPEVLEVGSNELLRVENDPNYPERGILRVRVEGGR